MPNTYFKLLLNDALFVTLAVDS